MKKTVLGASLLGIMMIAAGCASQSSESRAPGSTDPTISMIRLDDQGKATVVEVKESEYVDHLSSSLRMFNSAALPALESQERVAARASGAAPWMLRTVVLGVGANMEAGVGQWKVGFVPRFRVAFTNSTDPNVP